MIKLIKIYDKVGVEIKAPKTVDRLNILMNSAIIPRIGEGIFFCDEDYEQVMKDFEEGKHCFDIQSGGFEVESVNYYTDGRFFGNEDNSDCLLIAIFGKITEEID